MQRKPVYACHVRRTGIQKAHVSDDVWSNVQVKTSIWICHCVHGMDVWRCNRVIRCSVMPESPSQDNRTSHRLRHGEHRKSLRKRWPIATLCSKHKNDPSKGEDSILNGETTIMHCQYTNSGILRALFCVPGGIYMPDFLKLNLIMTARHYPGQ
jgi:hypothetical protein